MIPAAFEYHRPNSVQDAVKIIHDRDNIRAKLVQTYCGENINNPLLYDMILNTDHES